MPAHPAFKAAVRACYEAGLHGLLIPETFGGMGLDATGIHIALEEMGYGSSALAVCVGVSSFPAFGCTLLAAEDQALTDQFVLPFTADRKGEIKARGPVTKIFGLIPLVKPVKALYPALCAEHGVGRS